MNDKYAPVIELRDLSVEQKQKITELAASKIMGLAAIP